MPLLPTSNRSEHVSNRMARNACYVFTAIENGDLSFGTSSFE
ncbi:unnamed protein product, partial [Aureobasidium pullulans]